MLLNADMKQLIENHRAGMVATTNDDGTPSVSPKATFVILNDEAIAFGNIRSPGTLANIRKRPRIEICFIDVVLRKAVRVTGEASIIRKADADSQMKEAFEQEWATYVPHMSAFVKIDVNASEMILSPAYDLGVAEEELRRTNLEKLNRL